MAGRTTSQNGRALPAKHGIRRSGDWSTLKNVSGDSSESLSSSLLLLLSHSAFFDCCNSYV